MTWARDNRSGLLYTADGQGRLFALDEDRGFSPVLGLTALAPVGPMAVTHDGRGCSVTIPRRGRCRI